MLRSEYISRSGETDEERTRNHREYYSQFVDIHVKMNVLKSVSMDKLLRSTDPHFNDIGLQVWDEMGRKFPHEMIQKLKSCGDFLTAAGLVCIHKEAARQLVEEAREYED